MLKKLATIFLVLLLSGHDANAAQRGGGTPIPAQAAAAGYILNTYHIDSNFTSATVDTTCSLTSGFKVYNNNFDYNPCVYTGTTLEPDGTAFITANNGAMTSAARLTPGSPSSNPADNFVGTAFGGGAYFEAEVLFDPSLTTSLIWPAWWLESIEKLCNDYADQWAGQAANYHHFQEIDIVEWFTPNNIRYNATTIDWYGIFGVGCGSGQYCSVSSNAYAGSNTTYGPSTQASLAPVPPGTDFTLYHRYGVLWIPATVSTNGSYQFYFDDIHVATTILHSQFTTQSPPPTTSTPWTFGVGDTQHFAFLLGVLRVKAINVWQATAANNLTF